MTWDKRAPRDQAKPKSSGGWDGPGWWDEPAPAPKTAPSVRAANQATSIRASAPVRTALKGTLNGASGNGNGSSASMAAVSSAAAPTNGSALRSTGMMDARRGASARSRARSRSSVSPQTLRLVVGFSIGALGALFLAAAAVFGVSRAYDGMILPGVHAGQVDLSGLTREEAIAKLDTAYASLSQGTITLTTPSGTSDISFADAGRGPDSAAMADAAMAVGRSDDPLSSTATALRSLAGGMGVPIIVKLDPTALELKIRALGATSLQAAKDASVSVTGSQFAVVPSATGQGIDEPSVAKELIDQLASADAPSRIAVNAGFVTLNPYVTNEQAQAAIDASSKMLTDIKLTYLEKTWTITKDMVHSWIIFGFRSDTTFGPVVNPAPVRNFLNTISTEITVPAVEPRVLYNKSGQPTGVTGGKVGLALDVDNTGVAIESYLDGLSTGSSPAGSTIAVVTREVRPKLADNPELTGFVLIGSWKTIYFPGESNGNGVNIQVPSSLLNGQVIGPGEHFSFLNAVGPIDAAHGYTMGGVIKNGQSNHTGAMGGGICSASTTMFNAAARAGLAINERHAHFYYIDRYPKGLDATVYSNGSTTWDMRFTNDTEYPIVIRSYWTSGRTRSVVMQLWSLPNGRTTSFTAPVVTDPTSATDGSRYVSSLPAGQKTYRQEYPDPGFKAFVTRTVKDPTGAVLHYDEFYSVYTKVDGMLLIAGTPRPSTTPTPTPTGGVPTPTPKPTPTPTPAPAITPTPASTPTPSVRKRKLIAH